MGLTVVFKSKTTFELRIISSFPSNARGHRIAAIRDRKSARICGRFCRRSNRVTITAVTDVVQHATPSSAWTIISDDIRRWTLT